MSRRFVFLLCCISLFLCMTGALQAQSTQPLDMLVASFDYSPNDMTARQSETMKKDAEGKMMAIIKVRTNNPNDDLTAYEFDFGYMEDITEVRNDDREIWIYVQRGAKHITISRNGYKTIKNRDFGMTVEAGKVYELVLQVTVPKAMYQIVSFKIIPAEAKATVMYKKAGGSYTQFRNPTDKDGVTSESLEYGFYEYMVTSDSYHSTEGKFTLNNKDKVHTVNVKLMPRFSNITFDAGEGVEIYVNDEFKGKGRWTGKINGGNYNIECRKNNHKSVMETMKIEEGWDTVIKLKHPEPITGMLSVISRPSGAVVTIDGVQRGETPIMISNLLIGTHKVELSMPNYTAEKTTVEIKEDEVTNCELTLKNVADMKISSYPHSAFLYVDGHYVGITPTTKSKTPSGDYVVRLEKAGYRTLKKKVHFDSSRPNLTFHLKRQYQKKTSGYVELAGAGGNIFGIGIGGGIGGYFSNVNVEASACYGLQSETIYLNYTDGQRPSAEKLAPLSFGGKVGYGIIIGTRYRMTPQVGMSCLLLNGKEVTCSALVLSGGLRNEFVIVNHFGVSLTPEYSIPLSHSDVFKEISPVSSKMNGWCEGFKAMLGFYFYF